MNQQDTLQQVELLVAAQSGRTMKTASPRQRYEGLCAGIMAQIAPTWEETRAKKENQKQAFYFSAEFLMGRAVYNNLFALGKLDQVKKQWEDAGFSPEEWELEEDAALGNGGLGRLAACFLDSAATLDLPLDGYGIRYRYGLFRQTIRGGCQKEQPDDWMWAGDPWSIRREEDAVPVYFAGQVVKAVPYDMPVIGFGGKTVNTLRLWQSEPILPLNLQAFNDQKYQKASQEQEEAQRISQILYPNDTLRVGKQLRLKQEYFFTSASLQDIMRRFKAHHGKEFDKLPDYAAIQLNDTHPVLAIPELIRLLLMEDVEWAQAVSIAKKVFSYTNHTVMAEAMERWSLSLFHSVIPHIEQIIRSLDEELNRELEEKGVPKAQRKEYAIVANREIHMARLASYISHAINGVARIHTDILKDTVLNQWERLYPGKIVNETNGITPRRWLGLCNPQLSAFITELLGTDHWLTDLSLLEGLKDFGQDDQVIRRFNQIKAEKKEELCDFIKKKEKQELDSSFLFDIQVKRFHEYKRQTMNALGALILYFRLKEGKLSDFAPTVMIFGGKAASGYVRAKGSIKLIHEIASLVNNDPDMEGKLKIVFATDYNVSYAEKLIPAADVSEQISTAGTEASGTSNMKFMANGAVTLGTLDGANVEIVEQAGQENNYIFGLTTEQVKAQEETYDPQTLYENDPEIKQAVDALTDGTLQDSEDGLLAQLKQSLLEPTYNRADHYMVLADLKDYVEAKLRANRDHKDPIAFGRKCWYNLASCGVFSSDRTIRGYSRDIWNIQPMK